MVDATADDEEPPPMLPPVVEVVEVDSGGEEEIVEVAVVAKCLFLPVEPVCAQTFIESRGCPRTTPTNPAVYPATALFLADRRFHDEESVEELYEALIF